MIDKTGLSKVKPARLNVAVSRAVYFKPHPRNVQKIANRCRGSGNILSSAPEPLSVGSEVHSKTDVDLEVSLISAVSSRLRESVCDRFRIA